MNIAVEGNSNNVAGRDLHIHQQPPVNRLQDTVEQRNMRYHTWLSYNKQRKTALRRRFLNVWSTGCLALAIATGYGLYSITYPALMDEQTRNWFFHAPIPELFTLNSSLVLGGILATAMATVFTKGAYRKYIGLAAYLARKQSELGDEIKRLDSEIEYLGKKI